MGHILIRVFLEQVFFPDKELSQSVQILNLVEINPHLEQVLIREILVI